MVDRNWATTLASCNDGCWPATRCRRSSEAQARARRPRQPAEAATPSNFFCAATPGAGFAPSCLGECAIAARHHPEHRTMWYRKNVGGWERAARLIGGGVMLICGVVALHASPLESAAILDYLDEIAGSNHALLPDQGEPRRKCLR